MQAGKPTAVHTREQEQRRLAAVDLFEQGGWSQSQIAGALQVTQQAVSGWYRRWLAGGRDALASPGTPGAQCRLDAEQRARLRDVLRDGARACGFTTDGWTLARVRRVIAEQFAVEYATVNGVSKLLHRMGFSPQKPARQAVERDEDAIAEWIETSWPEIQKKGPPAEPGCVGKTKPARG